MRCLFVQWVIVAADYSGYVYCLDAKVESYTGFTIRKLMWGSPLVADGKVYIGDEDGDFVVLASDKKMKLLSETFLSCSNLLYPYCCKWIYMLQRSHICMLFITKITKESCKNK